MSIDLFTDFNFQGRQLTLQQAVSDLSEFNFNDVTRSVIVNDIDWNLFTEANASGQSVSLSPGQYPDINQTGFPQDALTSLGPV